MARVELNIKELRALLHWTEDAIGQEDSQGDEYSETWADMLGTLQQKLKKALDKDLDALTETVRRG